MSQPGKLVLSTLALAIGISIAAQAQAAPPRYRLTVLPPLPGFETSLAEAINAMSQVVVNSYVIDGSGSFRARPYVWQNGSVKPMPATRPRAGAHGINSKGWVTGYDGRTAVIFKGATISRIEVPGSVRAEGIAINNRGHVVVGNYEASGDPRGFFLFKGGVLTDLGREGMQSVNSINDLDQVAGGCPRTRPSGSPGYFACIYDNGSLRFITPGGTRTDSEAVDINRKGQIVGTYFLGGLSIHGFLYDKGVITDLGETSPTDINNAGTVVGDTYIDAALSAFVHTDGTTYDLNMVTSGLNGFRIQSAKQINGRGEIVGQGETRDGATRGFILRPIADGSENNAGE